MCGGSSTLLYIGTKEDKASPRIKEKNHGIRIRNACTVDYWHCFIVSFHGKHGFSIQKVMHLSPPSTNQPTLTVPEYMDGINLVSLRKKNKKKTKRKNPITDILSVTRNSTPLELSPYSTEFLERENIKIKKVTP